MPGFPSGATLAGLTPRRAEELGVDPSEALASLRGGTPPAQDVENRARRFNEQQAVEAAQRIAAAGHSGNPTYPMFAAGLEIWISSAWKAEYDWQPLGQLQSIDGPSIQVTTLDSTDHGVVSTLAPAEIPDTALATGNVVVKATQNVVYPDWSGRLYYHPQLVTQTSEDGILGSAEYGAEMFLAIAYRRPEEQDYLYLPEFILEWIGHASFTGYKHVLSNGVRYIDFSVSWLSVPFVYKQPALGQAQSRLLNPGPVLLEYLPTVGPKVMTAGVAGGFTLPAVVNAGRTWTYSLTNIPQGLSFDPRTRRVSGTPTGIPGTYRLVYTSTSGTVAWSQSFLLTIIGVD